MAERVYVDVFCPEPTRCYCACVRKSLRSVEWKSYQVGFVVFRNRPRNCQHHENVSSWMFLLIVHDSEWAHSIQVRPSTWKFVFKNGCVGLSFLTEIMWTSLLSARIIVLTSRLHDLVRSWSVFAQTVFGPSRAHRCNWLTSFFYW